MSSSLRGVPFIIGVAGGTASGKVFFLQTLSLFISKSNSNCDRTIFKSKDFLNNYLS